MYFKSDMWCRAASCWALAHISSFLLNNEHRRQMLGATCKPLHVNTHYLL